MQKDKLFLYIFLTAFSIKGYSQVHRNPTTKNDDSNKKDIQILKDFYTSYITQAASDMPGNEFQEKIDSIRKKYCTEKLYTSIKMNDSLEADPFIKAQMIDNVTLNTLKIIKDTEKLNHYIVSYSYPSGGTITIIHIALVEDKIDSVW